MVINKSNIQMSYYSGRDKAVDIKKKIAKERSHVIGERQPPPSAVQGSEEPAPRVQGSGHVWDMCGTSLGQDWVMVGEGLAHVWGMSKTCLEHV